MILDILAWILLISIILADITAVVFFVKTVITYSSIPKENTEERKAHKTSMITASILLGLVAVQVITVIAFVIMLSFAVAHM